MKNLFWLLLLGAVGMGLLMRWHTMQSGVPDFNIMDFEWPADRAQLNALIAEWHHDPVKSDLLSDQLGMDYIFMSLLFPAILVLCFWARANRNIIKPNYIWSKLLLIVGVAQLLAWSFDFCENARLESWLAKGVVDHILFFRLMVFLKFTIGISGFLLATLSFILLARRKLTKE